MVAGFFHEGYEEPLLMLMRRRGIHAGLVVKVSRSLFWFLHSLSRSRFIECCICSFRSYYNSRKCVVKQVLRNASLSLLFRDCMP